MLGEEEEQREPRRPRVVDKRVSARKQAPATQDPPAAESPAPASSPDPSPSPEIPASQVNDAAPEPAPSEPQPPAQEEPGAGPRDAMWTPEREAEAQAIAEELARVPALDWVANSAVTLANVAAAKIQRGQAPDAQLAIDALGALLDGLGDRLGEAEMPLKQTLAQLRMAYTQAVMPPGAPSV